MDIKKILKKWWNFNMKLACYVPFCGYLAQRLIIADTENEKASKEKYRGITNASTDALLGFMNHSINEHERRQREIEDMQQKRLQEEQDYLRKKVYQKTGIKNVRFNSDGSYVKLDNSDWIRTSEVEKKL